MWLSVEPAMRREPRESQSSNEHAHSTRMHAAKLSLINRNRAQRNDGVRRPISATERRPRLTASRMRPQAGGYGDHITHWRRGFRMVDRRAKRARAVRREADHRQWRPEVRRPPLACYVRWLSTNLAFGTRNSCICCYLQQPQYSQYTTTQEY